jgi:hypothetical protein
MKAKHSNTLVLRSMLLMLLIAISLLVITNKSYAAATELQGTITDEYGVPIKGFAFFNLPDKNYILKATIFNMRKPIVGIYRYKI